MRNFMQGSVRDFPISIVKNTSQNKTIIRFCFEKKPKQNQGHSVEKEQFAMGKKAYINA